MHGDYFDDFMPWSVNSDSLNLRDRRDMINLGKENLQYLARFWKERADKMTAKVKTEPNYHRRERFEQDAQDSAFKAREIKKIAEDAESKPRLFEKTTFETGSYVTCFLENPDRYVSGIIAKVKADADTNADGEIVRIKSVVLSIRIYDQSGQHLIDYVPDGFTLFTTEDFEYFKVHLGFFRLYLNYHTQSISDRTKTDRMLFCISGQPNPPDVA